MNTSDKLTLTLIILFVAVVLAVTAWIFLVQKNYMYVVEAPCNPEQESCYVRDCSEVDACPPNELSVYTIYRVSAKDFESCGEYKCVHACLAGLAACEEQVCGSSPDDECTE